MTNQLEVLTCTKCGAEIAFGDDATVACPFCQTANEVPVTYREMRASRRLDDASRVEAERLLRTLDRPPWLLTKILARMFDLPMLAFWLAYAIPIALYDVAAMLHFSSWIAPKLGLRSGDDVPFWMMISFGFSLVFVVIFVPRMLGIYANRRVTSRQRLLAALAAKPSKTPGGPAECRHCGAPLFVEPNALIAVCTYCSTQNAVHLETRLVESVRKFARKLAATVKDAAEADHVARRETRRLLVHELVRYASFTALFAALFSVVDKPTLGPIAAALTALLLIALPFLSAMRKSDKVVTKRDDAERRTGNDVPGWVAILGPAIVWAFFIYGPTFL